VTRFVAIRCVFSGSKFTQIRFSAYNAPPDHLVSWGEEFWGTPLTASRSRRLGFQPPSPTQIPGYAYEL